MKGATMKKLVVLIFCFVCFLIPIPVQAEGEMCDISGEGCRDKTPSQMVQTVSQPSTKKVKIVQKTTPSSPAPVAIPFPTLAKGSDHASVTIIAYTDFRCPPCTKANTILEQVMESYPDEIRVVYKHFPSPIHSAILDEDKAYWMRIEDVVALL